MTDTNYRRPTRGEKEAAYAAQAPQDAGSGMERGSGSDATNPPPSAASSPAASGRAHKATYATDKRKGGYLVRVEGPRAEAFVGREVPVTTRNGSEHPEKLVRLIWTGTDGTSGKPVALYTFESRPKEAEEVAF